MESFEFKLSYQAHGDTYSIAETSNGEFLGFHDVN
jgi:hypothetical protein